MPHGGKGGIAGIIQNTNRIAPPIMTAPNITATNMAPTITAVKANIITSNTITTAIQPRGPMVMNNIAIIKIIPTTETNIFINTPAPVKPKHIIKIVIVVARHKTIVDEKQQIVTPDIAITNRIGQKHNIGGNKQQQNVVIHTVVAKHNIDSQVNKIDSIDSIAKNNNKLNIHIEMQNILKNKA